MWGLYRAALFAILFLALLADADTIDDGPAQDSDAGAFIYPRDYPLTIEDGATINISWTTSLDFAELYYNHVDEVGWTVLVELDGRTDKWFEWTLDGVGGKNLSNPFWFALSSTGDADTKGKFWSSTFYVKSKSTETSSTSTPSSSRPPNPTSLLPSMTRIPLRSSDDAKTSSLRPAHQGVNMKAVIGLAAGLGVAFLLILGLIIAMLMRRQRKTPSSMTKQDYKPVSEEGKSSSQAEQPASRDTPQAVEHQDEWVRNRA